MKQLNYNTSPFEKLKIIMQLPDLILQCINEFYAKIHVNY